MSTETDENPPVPVVSDYIEMGYLALFMVIGAPVNFVAYFQLAEQSNNYRHNRLHLLKIHLNLSDLMVIGVYATSRLCWLITYAWRGGDLLCKIVKFLQALSFQVSSNIIVVIALDRLLSVLSPTVGGRSHGVRRVKTLLWPAWLVAVLLCLPQLFVWSVFEPYPRWPQCSQKWEIERWQQRSKALQEGVNVSGYSDPNESRYNHLHLLFIFWIPFTIVLKSYLFVTAWLTVTAKRSADREVLQHRTTARPREHSPAPDIVSTHMPRSAENSQTVIKKPSVSFAHTLTTAVITTDAPATPTTDDVDATVQTLPSTLNEERQRRSPLRIGAERQHLVAHRRNSIKAGRASAVRVSFVLVAAYVVCWLPYNALAVWKWFAPQSYGDIERRFYWLQGMIVFNSVINPFLYGTFGNAKPAH